ncbi:unnamed protein product [Ostreobium quekettii]|uniref:ubiquitinyl hydrolase 1 n=1 Tax=Ostreobium quekettii TaxID=121088 RepID=A0A8S1IXT3_9CHLO|nr:unnamed protein product [Ostreobium quekettii]
MIAREERAFCPLGAQQDVRDALEGVLSVVQKEIDALLLQQRRPLTFSSRLRCRIETLVGFPQGWNPVLDVPIIRNTGRGAQMLTPDDMGDVQMRLTREQGPCNGLLAESLSCECGYRYSIKYTDFASVTLPLPAVVEGGVERVQAGACLEDCLMAFCKDQEVGHLVCPRCSLQATVDGAPTRQHSFAMDGDQLSDCDEQSPAPARVGWFGRMLDWLGWELGTAAVAKTVPSSPSCTSLCSTSSGQSKGPANHLSDEPEVLSFTSLPSSTSSNPSLSTWSVVETGAWAQDWRKLVTDGRHLVASKSQLSLASYSRSSTPVTSFRESPTPSCTSSWEGWLGTYRPSGMESAGSLPAGRLDEAGKLNARIDLEKEGIQKALSLSGDVVSRIRETLRGDSGLDHNVSQLKEELEQGGIPWREKRSVATATTKIGRLPQVLLMNLQRRTSLKDSAAMVGGGLAVPLILDMSNFVHMSQAKGSIYHLVAMVIHVGEQGTGHYLAARRVFISQTESTWFLASDEDVQQVAEEDVLCLEPSMVLYEREIIV